MARSGPRTRFRGFDGTLRLVAKAGPTRAAAERALKHELVGRQTPPTGGAITGSTLVANLADAWPGAGHDWSIVTERVHCTVAGKNVKPAVGRLRVQEVTAGVVTRTLRAIADRGGAGVAKTARSYLSGMFGMAVEDRAAPVNPVRGSAARLSSEGRAPRAFDR